MAPRIAPLNATHLGALARIGREHWPTERWITRRYLSSVLRMDGVHATALMEKRVVGGIMAVQEDAPKWWLYYLAVSKAHRRQGIGTMLLRHVEAHIPKKALLCVDLEASDAAALAFYRAASFRRMGAVRHWFDGSRTGIIYAKRRTR